MSGAGARPGTGHRWAVIALLAAAMQGAPAQGDEISEADGEAIRAIISDQIDAFRRDDAEGAFGHASPAIRARFGDAQSFLAMVRRDYAPVYRPRAWFFQDLVIVGGAPLQKVLLVAGDNATVIAVYPMQRQADRSWRIDGCFLLPAQSRAL